MGLRSSAIIRVFLLLVIFGLGWYTFQLYAELFGRLNVTSSVDNVKEDQPKVHVEDPDELIDQKRIDEADKQWDKDQSLFHPDVKVSKSNPCALSSSCQESEFSFKVVTGAANVIGPSICFNNKIIMKNSLNNVDRGMNIAVFNGKTGDSQKTIVFDLYGKDSTEVKAFLKDLKEDQIILVTTSDDAAYRLDNEARELFANLGSSLAKDLQFRDNWVFVGGAKLKHPSPFEQIMKNNKETNKYGDWPEAITVEGCLPRLT